MEQFSAHEREELTETGVSQEGRPIVPSSGYEDPLHYEDPVMHISGAGHWFLEGWIGDHSVEFLVDSGSSVTAMSDIFYRGLVQAGRRSVRTTGGRALPSSGLLEGLTLFAEETGLIVGRTLVDPSGWKVPVLVSNFSQETVVVSPFTEVGMIAQVTAIQSVTDDRMLRRGVTGELPHHLRDVRRPRW